MSEQKEYPAWASAMEIAKPKFIKLAEQHNAVSWDEEAGYIRTAIEADERLQNATQKSLVSAIVNIAAIGVSVSPMRGLAFIQSQNVNLGDKKNANWVAEAKLKISYLGHVDVMHSTGSVNWITADVVREGDKFDYHGPAAMPDVSIPDAFADDRRVVRGSYAIAELPSGVVFCELMRLEELEEVEKASKASYGPWKNEFKPEMMKKSAINRIRKRIPINERNRNRMAAVNEIVAQEFDFSSKTQDRYTDEQKNGLLNAIGSGEEMSVYEYSQLDTETWIALAKAYTDTAPRGQKGTYRETLSQMVEQGREAYIATATELVACFEKTDDLGAGGLLGDVDLEIIRGYLPVDCFAWVSELKDAA